MAFGKPRRPTRVKRDLTMPWGHTYNTVQRLNIVVACGQLSHVELEAAILAPLFDPRLGTRAPILFDLVQLETSAPQLEFETLFRREPLFPEKIRRAVLVRESWLPLLDAFLRARCATRPVKCFSEMDRAIGWLHEGRPPWARMI
ncbi:MAG: hypothetical protein JNL39_10940 [Opitutaceae bacterium]|nr:hypothetical protein [Opitutaceae bacterium]